MNNILSITEYNLLDYSLRLQEAFEKGYRVSDSVDGSPMMVGFVYTATLVEREAEAVGEVCSVYVADGVPVAEVNPKYLASDASEGEKQVYKDIKNVVESVVGELAVKVKIDTTELQEQLKQGGDIEQAIEAALVVDDKAEDTTNKVPSKRGRK